MAHMMTRMTRWLDSHDSLARWLAVCQDPNEDLRPKTPWTKTKTPWTKTKTPWTKTKTPWTKTKTPLTKTKTPLTKTTDASR